MEAPMRCPYCNQEHPDKTIFCPTTGKKIAVPLYCTNCGAEVQPAWKVCPKCGNPVGEIHTEETVRDRKKGEKYEKFNQVSMAQQSTNRSKMIIIGIISLIVLVILSIYLTRFYRVNTTPTLPSPLTAVSFPSEPTPYPTDWPEDLKFPKDFVLVDSTSGTLPESTTKGWSAKLRYQGKPSEAENATTAFFEEKGWTIVENNPLDSGGSTLLLQREQANGIVVIDVDPNDPSVTLIIATFFL
jgi:hypothetical protein